MEPKSGLLRVTASSLLLKSHGWEVENLRGVTWPELHFACVQLSLNFVCSYISISSFRFVCFLSFRNYETFPRTWTQQTLCTSPTYRDLTYLMRPYSFYWYFFGHCSLFPMCPQSHDPLLNHFIEKAANFTWMLVT